MPHISQHKLPPQAWETVWNCLLQSLKHTNSSANYTTLLEGLLTPTEQIMIAKRLMIGILHRSNWPATTISQTLHLSTSTVYHHISIINHNQNYQQLLNQLFPHPIKQINNPSTPSFWQSLLQEIFTSYHQSHKNIKKKLDIQ